jgi:chaperonin GroES
MALNIKPLGDRVIVEALDAETKKGGIIIPDTAKERPQQGKVVAVGPGKVEKGERITLDVKKGDTVLFGKYSGTEITIEDKEYLILKADDILAIM